MPRVRRFGLRVPLTSAEAANSGDWGVHWPFKDTNMKEKRKYLQTSIYTYILQIQNVQGGPFEVRSTCPLPELSQGDFHTFHAPDFALHYVLSCMFDPASD